jgi:hypothetical protein
MQQFCWGPQPVKGVNLVSIGSPQGGHMGRWSGAADAKPDHQEHLRDHSSVDDESSDDDSVSSYSYRWVPGSGMPGSFGLVVGPFGPLAPVVSVEGGPWAAAVFATVSLLTLEPSSSADFGRRSKRPA